MNTVLFYVQHLLGIGHAFRATRIARALANAGARVHLAWGGSVPRSLDHSRSFPAGWLIIVGPERIPADTVALAAQAPPGVTVVREVPDLVRVFAAAAVSVSGAGSQSVCRRFDPCRAHQ